MTQDEKRENILEAARKRFAHFGVDKTTMNEIADDLGISKASLYYYFPDKLNLYAAVLEKIIEIEQEKEIPFINDKDLQKGMYKYLEKRTDFIIRNYRILEYLRNIGSAIPAELKLLFDNAKRRDITVLSAFLNKGKQEGILHISNLQKTTGLLNDCLNGLRMASLTEMNNFFPDEKNFKDLLVREKELTDIFLRALRC